MNTADVFKAAHIENHIRTGSLVEIVCLVGGWVGGWVSGGEEQTTGGRTMVAAGPR